MHETTDNGAERAIVFGLTASAQTAGRSERSLDELQALAESCGAVVVGRVVQTRLTPDGATYFGKGKIEELRQAAEAMEADLLICDDALTGPQSHNIEALAGVRVIDRTNLILDIFARRATTLEGRRQVELAQHRYRLPRLKQADGALSRQGGGIGTRGPGETKLESDRRHIRARISMLRRQLDEAAAHRDRLRQARRNRGAFTIAVVGYTNAGKSTLINRLCGTDLYAADQVFATLDATARKLFLPGAAARGQDVVLIDTIGFIAKLPHELIDAFKSTLAETAHADLILHVVDGSDPEAEQKMAVSLELLREIAADAIPRVTAINKTDTIYMMPDAAALYAACGRSSDRPVEISARTGAGLDELKHMLDQHISDI